MLIALGPTRLLPRVNAHAQENRDEPNLVLRSDTLAACADPPTIRTSRTAIGAITGPGAAGQAQRARHRVRRPSRQLLSAPGRQQSRHHQPTMTQCPTGGKERPAGRQRQPGSGQADSGRAVLPRRQTSDRAPCSRVRRSRVLARCSCLVTTAAGRPPSGKPPARSARQPAEPPRTARRLAGPRVRVRSAAIPRSPASRRRCTRLASSRRGIASQAVRGINRTRRYSSLTVTARSATISAPCPIPVTQCSPSVTPRPTSPPRRPGRPWTTAGQPEPGRCRPGRKPGKRDRAAVRLGLTMPGKLAAGRTVTVRPRA